jgi:UDP-N-acetyl-D-mannosaminuronic acid dehydrogenase
VFMICVPTPLHETHDCPQPDITYVTAAARAIAPLVRRGNVVILESTSPVGTTRHVAEVLQAEGTDLDGVHIAYCPERVLPGRIMTELVENDRVVGGLTPEATHKVAAFYRQFVRGEVLETDAATAEMCKLTENSYRDLNIAFANELSMLCARSGVDVWRLIELANRHPRVNILRPGPGVGGHCIAVDPWFMVASDPSTARLIRTGREVNLAKTKWVIDDITAAANDAMRRLGRAPRIACLGLAFKPDIDDLRESPACQITEQLIRLGFDVVAVEPNIGEHPSIPLTSLQTALRSFDVLAVLVMHREFVGCFDGSMAKGASVIKDYCGLFGA